MKIVWDKKLLVKTVCVSFAAVALTYIVGTADIVFNHRYPLKPIEYVIPERAPIDYQVQESDLYLYLLLDQVRLSIEMDNAGKKEVDLENIELQSEPYIAKELGIKSVVRPSITEGNLDENTIARRSKNNIVYNKAWEGSQIYYPQFVIAHEDIHSQWFAISDYKRLEAHYGIGQDGRYVNDETFTQIATLEVLANQSLDGDKMAELSLLTYVTAILENWDALKTGGGKKYDQDPVRVFLEAAAGKRESYGSLKLDGIAEFTKKAFRDVDASPIVLAVKDYARELISLSPFSH